MTVRRRLGTEFVEPVLPGSGGSCSTFHARFQAPKCWGDIDDRLRRLTTDHPLAEPVTVKRVEIALDAYSRSQSRDDLVEMTVRFYRCARKLVSNKRYASKTAIDTTYGLFTHLQLRGLIDDGYNIYVGKRTDDERQHIYLKETDSKVLLPIAEHRARTEFTLADNKVPGTDFIRWKTQDFSAFAHYFKYCRLRDGLPLAVVVPKRTLVQIGEARPRKTSTGHYRSTSRSTVADLKLNARAFDALRELTRRWQG
jgi:hypothetical protein